MQTATCKCGSMQSWGEMPPCNVCDDCGTAPGYTKATEPTPHRFVKKFDQNSGKPFRICLACMKRQEVEQQRPNDDGGEDGWDDDDF